MALDDEDTDPHGSLHRYLQPYSDSELAETQREPISEIIVCDHWPRKPVDLTWPDGTSDTLLICASCATEIESICRTILDN